MNLRGFEAKNQGLYSTRWGVLLKWEENKWTEEMEKENGGGRGTSFLVVVAITWEKY